MFWSWLFPPRAKIPEAAPDPGEESIPPLSIGPVDGTPATPVATQATTSNPVDAGAAAAVGAAFLLGAEMALHGHPQHDPAQSATHDPGAPSGHPGDTSAATHPGAHGGSQGDPGPSDGGS